MSFGGGGGGDTSKTTQTNEPPKWSQPYIDHLAKAVFGKFLPGGELTESPYPDQAVADFTPDQQAAFQNVRDLTGPESAFVQSGQARISDLMDTPFVNPIDDLIQNAFWGKINQAAPDVYALQAQHPQSAPDAYALQAAHPQALPSVYDLLKQNPQPSGGSVYDILKSGPPALFSGGFPQSPSSGMNFPPQSQSPFTAYLQQLMGIA